MVLLPILSSCSPSRPLRSLLVLLPLLAATACSRERAATMTPPALDHPRCEPGRYLGLLYEPRAGTTPSALAQDLRRRFADLRGVQVIEDPAGVIVALAAQSPETIERPRAAARELGATFAVQDIVTLDAACRVRWDHPLPSPAASSP